MFLVVTADHRSGHQHLPHNPRLFPGTPAPPLGLRLLGLHPALTRKRIPRVGRNLFDPVPKHVRVNLEIAGGLRYRHPRSFTSLTASSLNTLLNVRRLIVHFRFHHQIPKLSVFGTGGSSAGLSRRQILAETPRKRTAGNLHGRLHKTVPGYFGLMLCTGPR